MAEAGPRAGRLNVGVGITGIAGPGGGNAREAGRHRRRGGGVPKPSRDTRTFQFIGGREQVKYQATQAAMNMLRLLMFRA